jgi:hypothetical protein
LSNEAPSQLGVRRLLEWLRACESFGWPKSAIPELTDLFWKYKDRNGNLKGEGPTVETSGDCISCSVGNPGVYIKDGSMVCPHRPALNTSPSPAFVGSLCAHVPKGFACEICNHDGEQE